MPIALHQLAEVAKAIVLSHGLKSIGEFEEYMTLSKAVDVSEDAATTTTNGNAASKVVWGRESKPYDNTVLYQEEHNPKYYGKSTVAYNTKEKEEDDDSSSDDDEEEDEEMTPKTITTLPTPTTTTTTTTTTHTVATHDPFHLLPEEILTLHIFSYLDVDYYAILSLVHPTWESFTRTESIYKLLCQRCYLNQSKKKALHVHRFQGSYRNMLYERPRVKTGSGLYIMKYSEVVKIQRDMWTEIPVGAVLENIYYRYMYFQEDSRVLYALTHTPPHEMIPRILRMKHTGEQTKSTVWGRYEVKGYDVTVWASHPWHDVKMEMKLIPDGVDGARGRFAAMSFEKHLSSGSGNFDEYWSNDLVEYKVPNEYFRFLRDWRL
uniref:F-box domain-containing protein n=2 Tax=Ditylum brightwellii TaxID=49249 RepID=A0A7S4UXD0_9STRA